ncbi:hypothetical protein GDO78_009729 [Eleutherodactylus coqui]|uniref:Uncharacterized protein n=1 Tax=Eleutherodactylus coqui TaxID=57060 RepID=A0A8J6FAW5_ELECQ|nr:hypothetical protein GDO78_009729 [Eleutherodactylus coqui]
MFSPLCNLQLRQGRSLHVNLNEHLHISFSPLTTSTSHNTIERQRPLLVALLCSHQALSICNAVEGILAVMIPDVRECLS